MAIPLKYGLMITAGVVVWTLLAHLLFPPTSSVHTVGAGLFFNLLAIVFIALAIKTKQAASGGVISFKTGVKTGVATAFVYALTACIFFVFVVLFAPYWLEGQSRGSDQPFAAMVLGAFAGMFFGAIVLGLVYSTLITFFIIKTQTGRDYS